ncbi:MAG: hypothetical protein ACOY93_22035 [Bacillota bacterium]
MFMRGRGRPSKPASALGFGGGLIFILIGLTMAIPRVGVFGIFWTLGAAAITAYHGYNLFSARGLPLHEVELEVERTGDFEERLRKLERLRVAVPHRETAAAVRMGLGTVCRYLLAERSALSTISTTKMNVAAFIVTVISTIGATPLEGSACRDSQIQDTRERTFGLSKTGGAFCCSFVKSRHNQTCGPVSTAGRRLPEGDRRPCSAYCHWV